MKKINERTKIIYKSFVQSKANGMSNNNVNRLRVCGLGFKVCNSILHFDKCMTQKSPCD